MDFSIYTLCFVFLISDVVWFTSSDYITVKFKTDTGTTGMQKITMHFIMLRYVYHMSTNTSSWCETCLEVEG